MKSKLLAALLVIFFNTASRAQLENPETTIGKITFRALANLIDIPGIKENLDISPDEFELLKSGRLEVARRKDLKRTEDLDRAAEQLMRKVLGADQLRQYSRSKLLLSFGEHPALAFDTDAFATLFEVSSDNRDKYRQLCKKNIEAADAAKQAKRKAYVQSEIAQLGEPIRQKCNELFGPPFFDPPEYRSELPIIDRLYDVEFLDHCVNATFISMTGEQEKRLKQLHNKYWTQWLAENRQFGAERLERMKQGIKAPLDDAPLRKARVSVKNELMQLFTREQHSEITRLLMSASLQRDMSLPFTTDEVSRYLGLKAEQKRVLVDRLKEEEINLRKTELKAELEMMQEFVSSLPHEVQTKFYEMYGHFECWEVDCQPQS